jgi:hypothetical protein
MTEQQTPSRPAGHEYIVVDGLGGPWLAEVTTEYPEPSPIGRIDEILAASAVPPTYGRHVHIKIRQHEDERRRAVLFNDITHAPREDATYLWLSDRQQLADYLWSQGWRRDVRPEDVTETVTYDGFGAPIVHDTKEDDRG